MKLGAIVKAALRELNEVVDGGLAKLWVKFEGDVALVGVKRRLHDFGRIICVINLLLVGVDSTRSVGCGARLRARSRGGVCILVGRRGGGAWAAVCRARPQREVPDGAERKKRYRYDNKC